MNRPTHPSRHEGRNNRSHLRRTPLTAEEIAELEAQPEVELTAEEEARLDAGWEADLADIFLQNEQVQNATLLGLDPTTTTKEEVEKLLETETDEGRIDLIKGYLLAEADLEKLRAGMSPREIFGIEK